MTDQTTPSPEEILKAQTQFLNMVWTDAAYRARLEKDPKAALEEIGGHVPDGIDIRVVHDTDKVKYLHIPSPPPEGEISDQDLLNAQGGTTWFCASAVVSGILSISLGITIVETT
jgi:Nitrile hydratase, alpha chain